MSFEEVYKNLISNIDARPSRPGVLISSTGSGKSTSVPAYLANEFKRRVFVVEPTIATCKLLANRLVNYVQGRRVGWSAGRKRKFVNYKINKGINPITRIPLEDSLVVYCTPGYIKHIIINGGTDFMDYLILDEFHVGTLDYDLLLHMWSVKKGCKLLIMSATIDPEPLEKMYNAVIARFDRRDRSLIKVSYSPPERGVLMTDHISDIIKSDLRDIKARGQSWIVFLPGSKEIESMYGLINGIPNVIVTRLYSQFTELDIDSVSKPIDRDMIRIILATNMVETGVTLPNLTIVYDSMAERIQVSAPEGETRINLSLVSQSTAEQRKGRLGRLGEGGYCYRMISEEDFSYLERFPVREKDRLPLHLVTLEMVKSGMAADEINRFHPMIPWNELRSWGLLDNGKLSESGKIAATNGISPRAAVFVQKLLDSRSGISEEVALGFGKIIDAGPNYTVPTTGVRSKISWFEILWSTSQDKGIRGGAKSKTNDISSHVKTLRKVYSEVFPHRVLTLDRSGQWNMKVVGRDLFPGLILSYFWNKQGGKNVSMIEEMEQPTEIPPPRKVRQGQIPKPLTTKPNRPSGDTYEYRTPELVADDGVSEGFHIIKDGAIMRIKF